MVTLSNPRLEAVIEDYPLGGNKRGRCVFKVENNPKRGNRVGRTTTGKTKYDVYGGATAIVDGSNGRTYILQDAGVYGFIKVKRSDFMDATDTFGKSAVFPGDERYEELKALLAGVAN